MFATGIDKSPLYRKKWGELSAYLNNAGLPIRNFKQWRHIWKHHIDFTSPNRVLKNNLHAEAYKSVETANRKRKLIIEQNEECQPPRKKIAASIENESAERNKDAIVTHEVNTNQKKTKRIRLRKRERHGKIKTKYAGCIATNSNDNLEQVNSKTEDRQTVRMEYPRNKFDLITIELKEICRGKAFPYKAVAETEADQSIRKTTEDSNSDTFIRERLLRCMLKLFKRAKITPESIDAIPILSNLILTIENNEIRNENAGIQLEGKSTSEFVILPAKTQVNHKDQIISLSLPASPTIETMQCPIDGIASISVDSGIDDVNLNVDEINYQNSGFQETSKSIETQTNRAINTHDQVNSSSFMKCEKHILLRKLTEENKILKKKIELMKKNEQKLWRHWEKKLKMYETKVKALEMEAAAEQNK